MTGPGAASTARRSKELGSKVSLHARGSNPGRAIFIQRAHATLCAWLKQIRKLHGFVPCKYVSPVVHGASGGQPRPLNAATAAGCSDADLEQRPMPSSPSSAAIHASSRGAATSEAGGDASTASPSAAPPVGCWRRSTRSPRGRPHSSMHAPPPPANVRLAPSATGLRRAPSASGSERPPRGTCRWHGWRAQAWRCASATRARAGGARG